MWACLPTGVGESPKVGCSPSVVSPGRKGSVDKPTPPGLALSSSVNVCCRGGFRIIILGRPAYG